MKQAVGKSEIIFLILQFQECGGDENEEILLEFLVRIAV